MAGEDCWNQRRNQMSHEKFNWFYKQDTQWKDMRLLKKKKKKDILDNLDSNFKSHVSFIHKTIWGSRLSYLEQLVGLSPPPVNTYHAGINDLTFARACALKKSQQDAQCAYEATTTKVSQEIQRCIRILTTSANLWQNTYII